LGLSTFSYTELAVKRKKTKGNMTNRNEMRIPTNKTLILQMYIDSIFIPDTLSYLARRPLSSRPDSG
jgi:hypothetical protein